MVLNEKAITELGFRNAADAVNKNVVIDWQGQTYRWAIIGVVKDFHFQDLHVPITGYAFYLNNKINYNYIIAHIS